MGVAEQLPYEIDLDVAYARAYVKHLVECYWQLTVAKQRPERVPPLRDLFADTLLGDSLSEEDGDAIYDTAVCLSNQSLLDASFCIGEIYTQKLPKKHRARFGVYFTPPALTNRLLDDIEQAGFDWTNGNIIDPACGGGAFLAPIALRMKNKLASDGHDNAYILNHIAEHLTGIELDPFSAWMSQVFLELSLMEECISLACDFPIVIHVGDTLASDWDNQFDLVVGNPPYAKVKLNDDIRSRFGRSLYGHANLYGLFTDKALSMLKAEGILAFVTPTSFLSGQYFKALRQLLTIESSLFCIDFIESRKGVFASVLQETVLAVFVKGAQHQLGHSHTIKVTSPCEISVVENGQFCIHSETDSPWLIPRSHDDAALLADALTHSDTLARYGYKVSTGPLVWNRHKAQLSSRQTNKTLPLLWGECVSKDGHFAHKAQKKNHEPWFRIDSEKDDWLIVETPCLLLQRTTAKEQASRLIGAIVEQDFIQQYGGVVVENHLNMVKPNSDTPPAVDLATLQFILKSPVVDTLFRMMNGSVAVSAYELEALPLPTVEKAIEIQDALIDGMDQETVQTMVKEAFSERLTAAA